MKILIIEDDDYKANDLLKFSNHKFSNPEVKLAVSLAEAIDEIDVSIFDLIFIDMAIPSHTAEQGEGSPMSLLTGGIDILLELSEMHREDRCIVITQHPSIEISEEHYPLDKAPAIFKSLLNCEVVACIYYVVDDSKWMIDLEKALQNK
ncbi:response regulator [Pseudoalteromonas carrageenovora]|uniref:response regulator n=1 Tax=Pseudoalteromonas carrageenovora TaxID=227 RepID=UPI0026E25D02|nr:response regulator [Pseudoalteromonas carrageenovora]MDO6835790.1 response regulator [Pseudoalteromonas carrageenovora]